MFENSTLEKIYSHGACRVNEPSHCKLIAPRNPGGYFKTLYEEPWKHLMKIKTTRHLENKMPSLLAMKGKKLEQQTAET